MSAPLIPAARTATSSSPGAGLGIGVIGDRDLAVADGGGTHRGAILGGGRPATVPASTATKGDEMAKKLKPGDRVEWNTPQGKTTGKVKEKVTGTRRVGNQGQKGTEVKGSKDDPRYVVESEKSGKRAAHRPQSLRRK